MEYGGDIIQWAAQTVFRKGRKTLCLYLVLDDEELRSVEIVFGKSCGFRAHLEGDHATIKAPYEEFEDCLKPLRLTSQGSFNFSLSEEKSESGFVDVLDISFNGGVGVKPLFGLGHIGSGAP